MKKTARVLVAGAVVWVVSLVVLAAGGCSWPKPPPVPPGAQSCATACVNVESICQGVSHALCTRHCTDVATNSPNFPSCIAIAENCAAVNVCDPG